MAPQNVGRYQVLELLGEGGMARVFKAYDPQLSRHVAIKVINSALADSEDYQQKFRREANIVAKLEDLAVVPIYDFGEEQGGTLFIVMRLMEGGTLAQRIAKSGPFTFEQALNAISRLGVTLDRFHQHGIVHLDLKTSNILYNTEGQPFIADFGIARFQQAVTRSGRSLSAFTPKYASPEQIDDDDPGAPSDLYSFGLIAYEMLTGRLPFEGNKPTQWMRLHAEAPVANIRELRPDLPTGIEEVFYKMLAKEPEYRYPTAHDFVNDLDLVAQGKKTLHSATPTVASERARRGAVEMSAATAPRVAAVETPAAPAPRRKLGWLIPLMAVVLLLGLGAVAAANLGLLNGALGGATPDQTGGSAGSPVAAVSTEAGAEEVVPPAAASDTATPSATTAPTAVATETPPPTESPSPEPSQTATPTEEPTETATRTPTATATAEPTATTTPDVTPGASVPDGSLIGTGVEITRQVGGTGLQVSLLLPEGNAWSGAYMEVYEQQADVSGNPIKGGRAATGNLDDLGRANFELNPGAYVVCTGAVPGYGFTSRDCIYNVNVERNEVTTVKLQSGRLEIAVVFADGSAWDGLYTSVHTQKADVSGNPVEDGRAASGNVDNTGLVSYALTPGLYMVMMDLPGYSWGTTARNDTQTDVPVRAGQTNRILISLGQLQVGLVRTDGTPAQGVYFEVFTQGRDVSGNTILAERAASGNTDNGGLPPWR